MENQLLKQLDYPKLGFQFPKITEENKIYECGAIARNTSVMWNKREYRCNDCSEKNLLNNGVKIHY
jgi:DNA-directed RNA polymerase subunit RPC12/RpoP